MLWFCPARLRRRLWQLLAGLGGVIVGGGWWIVIAQLTPAADRPYFGGSTDNNILELTLGYNGLGRLAFGVGVLASAARLARANCEPPACGALTWRGVFCRCKRPRRRRSAPRPPASGAG